MSKKIEVGDIVVYRETKDYFLYQVTDIKGNIVTLNEIKTDIKDGVGRNTIMRSIRRADPDEIKIGFRVPNPSNYTANDKMYHK